MRHELLPPLVRGSPTCHHCLDPRLLNGILSPDSAQFHTLSAHSTSDDTPSWHPQNAKKVTDLTDDAESIVQDHTDDDDDDDESVQPCVRDRIILSFLLTQ
jgi:hypothetical protein